MDSDVSSSDNEDGVYLSDEKGSDSSSCFSELPKVEGEQTKVEGDNEEQMSEKIEFEESKQIEDLLFFDKLSWEEVKKPRPANKKVYLRESHYLFSKNDNPVQIFNRFFPEDIFQLITSETNKYARNYIDSEKGKKYLAENKNSRIKRWKETNSDEIRRFLGMQLLMGIIKLPGWRDYWGNYDVLLKTKVSDLMKLYRYDIINKFFQVYAPLDLESPLSNQSNKILFFNSISDRFKSIVIPNEYLSIDERICRFQGRFHSKVFMPLKPDRWGIKCICLCDSNGFALKIHICVKGFSKIQLDDLVIEMMHNFKDFNHKLCMDNYYCHAALIEKLSLMKIWVTGTVRVNRIDLPQLMKERNVKRGETVHFIKGEINAIKSKENRKPFIIMTNFDSFASANENEKPMAIMNYNKNMKGVDIMNQYCAYYRFFFFFSYLMSNKFRITFKNKKWWRVIFNNIFEICVVNSFLIYKKFLKKKIGYKKFKLMIIHELLGKNYLKLLESKDDTKLSSSYYGISDHYPEKLKNCKSCKVCKTNEAKKKSSYGCKACSRAHQKAIPLCVVPCFEEFHIHMPKYLMRKKKIKKEENKEINN